MISTLSGGEKGRVSLAKLMLSEANFLILDEPTNHLDIASKEILEEALNNYSGTVLYVSHDRYFINQTATRILELVNQTFVIISGTMTTIWRKKRNSPKLLHLAHPPGIREITGMTQLHQGMPPKMLFRLLLPLLPSHPP